MYVRVCCWLVVRWTVCRMSSESRYCWQRVGWRCVLSWRWKCVRTSASTWRCHRSATRSTRSSETDAVDAYCVELSKVCLTSLNSSVLLTLVHMNVWCQNAVLFNNFLWHSSLLLLLWCRFLRCQKWHTCHTVTHWWKGGTWATKNTLNSVLIRLTLR